MVNHTTKLIVSTMLSCDFSMLQAVVRFRSPLSMPKPRKSRSHRSQVAANLTGPGSSASGAGPSQMSAKSMTINYTAMPTETLRFMLSQRHLNQTGPRRALITRLQESDSPASNTAPQVPDQLSAMIASIVEAKLANLNGSRSTSEPVVPPRHPSQH